ncbi:hypothetical protein DIPPA_09184 [Diplonema papillatum]|nr:hypothetical protein DIPPA_09184 [Diplonema papillatum]|eukprot:gene19103-29416_t
MVFWQQLQELHVLAWRATSGVSYHATLLWLWCVNWYLACVKRMLLLRNDTSLIEMVSRHYFSYLYLPVLGVLLSFFLSTTLHCSYSVLIPTKGTILEIVACFPPYVYTVLSLAFFWYRIMTLVGDTMADCYYSQGGYQYQYLRNHVGTAFRARPNLLGGMCFLGLALYTTYTHARWESQAARGGAFVVSVETVLVLAGYRYFTFERARYARTRAALLAERQAKGDESPHADEPRGDLKARSSAAEATDRHQPRAGFGDALPGLGAWARETGSDSPASCRNLPTVAGEGALPQESPAGRVDGGSRSELESAGRSRAATAADARNGTGPRSPGSQAERGPLEPLVEGEKGDREAEGNGTNGTGRRSPRSLPEPLVELVDGEKGDRETEGNGTNGTGRRTPRSLPEPSEPMSRSLRRTGSRVGRKRSFLRPNASPSDAAGDKAAILGAFWPWMVPKMRDSTFVLVCVLFLWWFVMQDAPYALARCVETSIFVLSPHVILNGVATFTVGISHLSASISWLKSHPVFVADVVLLIGVQFMLGVWAALYIKATDIILLTSVSSIAVFQRAVVLVRSSPTPAVFSVPPSERVAALKKRVMQLESLFFFYSAANPFGVINPGPYIELSKGCSKAQINLRRRTRVVLRALIFIGLVIVLALTSGAVLQGYRPDAFHHHSGNLLFSAEGRDMDFHHLVVSLKFSASDELRKSPEVGLESQKKHEPTGFANWAMLAKVASESGGSWGRVGRKVSGEDVGNGSSASRGETSTARVPPDAAMEPGETMCSLSSVREPCAERASGHATIPRSVALPSTARYSAEDLYPTLCTRTWLGVDVFTYAFFSAMAYLPPDGFAKAVDYFNQISAAPGKPPMDWTVRSEIGTEGVINSAKVYDVFSKSRNMSIVAIRGTNPLSPIDMLQDVSMYIEVMVYNVISSFVPLMGLFPHTLVTDAIFVSSMAEKIDVFRLGRGRENLRHYWEHVLEYAEARRASGVQVALTGHSLGGAIGMIVGARLGTLAVGFHSPGIVLSHKKFGITNMADAYRFVANVIPEQDLIPLIDKSGGEVHHILCASKRSDTCHFMESTIAELWNGCPTIRNHVPGIASLQLYGEAA